jgi:hypothetical protein
MRSRALKQLKRNFARTRCCSICGRSIPARMASCAWCCVLRERRLSIAPPIIGYLHRGIEKILENRPILGSIRYMDNVDYLSPMLNEIAYVGAV